MLHIKTSFYQENITTVKSVIEAISEKATQLFVLEIEWDNSDKVRGDSEQKGRGRVVREAWITDNGDVQNIVTKNDGKKCVRESSGVETWTETNSQASGEQWPSRQSPWWSLFVCLHLETRGLHFWDKIWTSKKWKKRLNWKICDFTAGGGREEGGGWMPNMEFRRVRTFVYVQI